MQGKQVSLAQAPETSSQGNVVDLMAALKASLNAREDEADSNQGTQSPQAGRHQRLPESRQNDEKRLWLQDLKLPASLLKAMVRAGYVRRQPRWSD